jgi:uncharacterized coiled-coil DUF342 family protein
MKKFSRGVKALTFLGLCLSLCQCEKHQQLRNQKAELQRQFDQLQAEAAQLERQLTEARKALPPAGGLEEAARQLESRARTEAATLEAQFQSALAGVKRTETEIAALRQKSEASAPAQ